MQRFLKISIDNKSIYLYTFLLIHLIVWSCIGLIRSVLPTDSLEGIYWGSLADFGTPKHPPLAAWITYGVYTLFKTDFSIYMLSQSFIIIGFIFIYKLAQYFLEPSKAILSVIVLESCWIYSYITGYYGFNPDVVLLLTLPAIAYYFYKSIYENKPKYWLLLGIFTGISLLDKYQTGFLIFGMIIWTIIFKREIFKNYYLYLAMIISLVIFSPHLLWLIKYDFFPMLYYGEKLATINWYNHITSPLSFFVMQLGILAGIIIVGMFFIFKYKHSFKIQKADEKFWFLTILTFTPLIVHLLLAIYTGSNMRPQWNYVFWFLSGILFFYMLPDKLNQNEFKFVVKFSYIVMLVVSVSFGTMLTVEKNYRSRYPVNDVFQDFKNIWTDEFGVPLKYVGGFHEFTFPLSIYGDTHPINIMDTFGYKNIWIDEQDLENHGALIISRRPYKLDNYVRKSCPYFTEDNAVIPKEYKFIVRNALNMPREYTIYYFIVPPINVK